MKIALDLQACQSPTSRHRGIGRYSLELARALLRNRGSHRIHVLLNAAFEEGDGSLRETLLSEGDVSFEHYELLHLEGVEGYRRQSLQHLNDEILNWRYACADADALHVSSIFEGWYGGDEHVSQAVGDVPGAIRSATLYDLIPLLFPDQYLTPALRQDFHARLGLFHQFDLIFAISASARDDAIRHLRIAPDRIVNIRAAAARVFRQLSLDADKRALTLSRHGLNRRFILNSGGNDRRKNLDALLQAYAALPSALRAEFQLAIVCALTAEDRRRMGLRTAELGLANDVVLTGYIDDEELNLLYNACDLFAFPSLYEGFGLPVLEAMTCGACVVASNTSSMPEIVGRPEVLFDPLDVAALTRLMLELLTSPARRLGLGESNATRAAAFSWDAVAQTMLSALEDAHARRVSTSCAVDRSPRPRIAVFAPLQSSHVPATVYVTAMLPHWSKHFDIEIVAGGDTPRLGDVQGRFRLVEVSELREHRDRYETVLYVLGNSELHAEMYELLGEIPGIALMLDGSLGRLVDWLEASGRRPGILLRELMSGNTTEAMRDLDAAEQGDLSVDTLVARHPLARRVPLHASGIIFQTHSARSTLLRAYPDLAGVASCVVPPASMHRYNGATRGEARAALGLAAHEVLIASFGPLDETARVHVLLGALARSPIANRANVRVALVGELATSSYRSRIADLLAQHPLSERIVITGAVDGGTQLQYRGACDIAVQLGRSSDFSSATIHAALEMGCATIVADETLGEDFPIDVVERVRIQDAGAVENLLTTLVDDAGARERLSEAARLWIEQACHPARVAAQHAAAIALLPAIDRARCAQELVRRIAGYVEQENLDHTVTLAASDAIASGLAIHPASGRRIRRS
jgi:glycosyltransferase involved in cell wall biosynthesis